MEISTEKALEKIEQWREDRSELLVKFKTSEGSSLLPAHVESVINDRLLLKLDRGMFIVMLLGATFTDESDTKPQHDSMTVQFPKNGICYLRVMNEWPDEISDEAMIG